MASEEVPRALPAASLRVAVASDQHLVAESVRAGLQHRGHDAVGVRWPVVREPAMSGPTAGQRRLRRPRRGAGPPPDVAVLLSDLSRFKQLREAQVLLSAIDVPWLVLAGVPRGPTWGALYDAGAGLVVTTDIGLDEVCVLVDDLYAGRGGLGLARRRDLIKAWRTHARDQGELTARIKSLTGREEEVLQQLYQGMAVRLIAERGAVTEATVRSQVKAILRKLDVNSQLAAVAAYRAVNVPTPHQPALESARVPGG